MDSTCYLLPGFSSLVHRLVEGSENGIGSGNHCRIVEFGTLDWLINEIHRRRLSVINVLILEILRTDEISPIDPVLLVCQYYFDR